MHVNLTTIHRQSDPTFISILQNCRLSTPLAKEDEELLLYHPCNVQNAVQLFPTRREVRRVNAIEFDRLTTRKYGFRCFDHFQHNPEHKHLTYNKQSDVSAPHALATLHHHRFENYIELREGMLVLLLVNLDFRAGLINGSQGTIIGFHRHGEPGAAKQDVKSQVNGEYEDLRFQNVEPFIEAQQPSERFWRK